MTTPIPMGFDDFVGNDQAVAQLKLYVEDAKVTHRLPHIGLFGPAGHGKTTLATIIAQQLERRFVYINSTAIKDPRTLRHIITNPENLARGTVVCLDEAHQLPKAIQDSLLSVLEHPAELVTVWRGETMNDALPSHMSFVLATTHQGYLSNAILSRLESVHLHQYSTEEKHEIAVKYLNRVHKLTAGQFSVDAILEIGRRARSGRHVVKICDNVMRQMRVSGAKLLSPEIVDSVFGLLGLDNNGLSEYDILLLKHLQTTGGCGLDALSAYLDIPQKDIKSKIEPWLLRQRFIVRSSGGRILTDRGRRAISGERVDA